jgi:hypothetical protein
LAALILYDDPLAPCDRIEKSAITLRTGHIHSWKHVAHGLTGAHADMRRLSMWLMRPVLPAAKLPSAFISAEDQPKRMVQLKSRTMQV